MKPNEAKPKLQVGDTFVMNEAMYLKRSGYAVTRNDKYTIRQIGEAGEYILDNSARFFFADIDDHLPVTEDLPTMVTGEVKAFTPAPPAYAPGDIYSGWEDLKPFPEYINWKRIKKQFSLTDESLLVIVKSDGGLSSANGTIIKLNKDDGSDCPFFTDGTEANLCGFSQWLAPLPCKRAGMVEITSTPDGDRAIRDMLDYGYATTYTNDAEPLSTQTFDKASELMREQKALYDYNHVMPILTPHLMSNDTSAVQKLSAWAKRTFSPDQKALFKAGFIDGNGAPTSRGRDELGAILFEANLAELVKTAKAENKCDKA